jgi:chemotaxis protein CheD
MLKLGAQRKNLLAKAFGGGSLYRTGETGDNFYCVGDVNTRFIREFLLNDGIPLVAEDLGGEVARVIRFQYEDFAVYMKRVRQTMAGDLVVREKKYWQRSVASQEEKKPQVELWD